VPTNYAADLRHDKPAVATDRSAISAAPPPRPVAILLSAWNGERFLQEQLDSFVAQTHPSWTLYWRDDGSADATETILQRFSSGPAAGRSVMREWTRGRLGVTASFLALLRTVVEETTPGTIYAFADQDDVWLPEKVARGVAALEQVPVSIPALYCARQVLVDDRLHRLGLSFRLHQPPGFPAALTQNIATGCTVMMNQAAARLVAASRAPCVTLHDWWCYLLVAAAGGRLLVDETPVVLYRQHGANAVGAPLSLPRRAVAALRRGPRVFMNVLRHHLAALDAQSHLLAPEAAAMVAEIDAALGEGKRRRFACLRLHGLRRQTWAETLLFRLWFMLG
jgi:Glycosyl transferase family 2